MKISFWTKCCLYLSISALFLSGLSWVYAHYALSSNSLFQKTTSSLEPLSLKVHGAAAMVFLITFGSLLPLHIKSGWNGDKNKVAGLAIVAICGILIITGYGLYYFGGENSRLYTHWTHLILGFSFPVLLFLHIKGGKK